MDFPMPGSPPSSTTPPGTRPPPSTRSNSSMPLAMRLSSRASTSDRRWALPASASPRVAVGARGRRLPLWSPVSSRRNCNAGTTPDPLQHLPAALDAHVEGFCFRHRRRGAMSTGIPVQRTRVASRVPRTRPGKPHCTRGERDEQFVRESRAAAPGPACQGGRSRRCPPARRPRARGDGLRISRSLVCRCQNSTTIRVLVMA